MKVYCVMENDDGGQDSWQNLMCICTTPESAEKKRIDYGNKFYEYQRESHKRVYNKNLTRKEFDKEAYYKNKYEVKEMEVEE